MLAYVPAPTFTCSWDDLGLAGCWISVAGDLDLTTSPQLRRTVSEAQRKRSFVVLDLGELAFMDSGSVTIIVDASLRARAAGNRLVMVRAPDIVKRMFKLTRTWDDVDFLDLAPDEEFR